MNLKDLDNAFLVSTWFKLRTRLIKLFGGSLNHIETSKHCLTYIYVFELYAWFLYLSHQATDPIIIICIVYEGMESRLGIVSCS